MTTNSNIVDVLQKSRKQYEDRADLLEAEILKDQSNDELFSEFKLCWENIYEIDDQIRFYSVTPMTDLVRRFKRLYYFYK